MRERSFKIAVASSGLGHVSRGIEAWAADLGHSLAARGYSVFLCKGGGSREKSYERVIPCWKRGATKTTKLLQRMPPGLWRLGLSSAHDIEQITFTWNLLKVLRKEEIDLLHVQDPRIAILVQCAHQLGLVRTRAILGHGTNESYEFLEKITYLHQLAPSHLAQAKADGVWKRTWSAIPNFIDTQVFHSGRSEALRAELGIPANALVVLTAAAIKREHKRIDYLLREFETLRLKRPDLPVWLLIAGGGEAETAELIEEGSRRLGDRVRFLVQFPRSRMPDLYRAADLFVFCSLREMMPIALLEATASGLPCLVHCHPVMEWIVGEGGRKVDMSNATSLASAMENIVDDPIALEQLARAARDQCTTHFSRDRVLDQIIEYYRFVLSDSEARTGAIARVGEERCRTHVSGVSAAV